MKLKSALLLIILFLATLAVAEEQAPKDTLVIAISSDFEPFTFLNAEGKPAGMFVDIWRLWAQKTGKQIEFISSNWKISLENLKNQKADIHSGFLYSPEHFEWINGSQSFYECGVNLFYPLKQGHSDIKEFSGRSLAVLRGSQLEEFLTKYYPDIQVLACDTREELVKISREEKTKGFIAISQVGQSVIDRMGLTGEFGMNDKHLYSEKFCAGVLMKNTELLALVDKGFNAISYQELSEIESRWIQDPTQRYYYKLVNMIRLTPDEDAWLKNHKTIRVGMTPVVPPLKFSDKGVIKGIEPDYLNLFSEYTGIQFEYVICDFPEIDAKVKSGQIDMFLSFNIPERLAYMTFTEPFMDFKQVIITRTDAPFISGIGALKGKKVATIKGVRLYDKMLSPYPEIKAVQVDNSDELFKAVSESKADALISRTYIAGYVLQNYPNLKIAGIADLPPEPFLYAVRKDYPELVSILNKAIAAITPDRKDAIVQKWFSVRIEYSPNWVEILKWAFVIGGTFALLLGLSLLWNRRLSREIDKRKRAEEEQRNITERLSLACRAGGIGIWEFDTVNNNLIWDDQMFSLYGITPVKFSGTYEAWRAGVHPEDLQKSEAELQMAIRGEKDFDTEFRVVWSDGTIHSICALASVQRDSLGHAINLIGTNYDITERKRADEEKTRLQAQFLQAQKMESVGRLAGGVAHDFNNMLGIILGYAEITLDQVEPTEPIHANLEEIRKAANRSADLTRQLLAFARKQTIIPKVLDLNETLEGMLKMLRRLIGEDIDLVWLPGRNLWPVKLDPSQIDQILANLCVNARDALRDVGKVTIETGTISFDESYCADHLGFFPGDYVMLAVSDNGSGMDKEILDNIFEPFFTTKGVGKGSGLGLATVYGIVKQNSGFINVYSEPDQGTTFKIYLSRHMETDVQEQIAVSAGGGTTGHETILLVEDEIVILTMTSMMLERLGYTVLAASTPNEAIRIRQSYSSRIDLLMTDVVMPEMNGKDLAEKLLHLSPDLKCLYMSGYTANAIAHHGVLDKGVHFIHKPFSKQDLAAKLREVLEVTKTTDPQ